MSFFTRTLGRLRREDHGFSLMETVVALGVLFISLLVLARTAAVGFTDIALSRQRTQANQLANKLLEQVRGLSYARVGQGLQTADMAGDPSIIPCADGSYYYVSCPPNPNAEKIVHTPLVGNTDVPLVPHRGTLGTAQGYTSTFSTGVYVTHAKNVPIAGAYRVTAVVSWSPPARQGVRSSVTTQSLLYTPEGTTDASTGGGTAPFFYGTGGIGRAPITITPNAGVTGGTGITGLAPWDSVTEDLYGLDASVQQQQLTQAQSKTVLTGAHKVVSDVETVAGGDTAEATADDDPATPPTTSSAPPGLMQSAVAASLSGGGNSIEVQAASGGTAECVRATGWKWGTGVETGGLNGAATSNTFTPMGGMFTTLSGSSVTADTSVKRSGNFSLRVSGAANTNNYAGWFNPTAGVRTGVTRFAFRFASLPTADVAYLAMIESLNPSGTRDLTLRYISSSQRLALGFQEGSNAPVGVVDGPVIQAGTWYTIDLKVDMSANPHTAEWMVDGAPQPSTSNPQAAGDVYNVRFGRASQDATTFTANYDDMQVSTVLADYPMPDATFKVLKPSGLTGNPSQNFENDSNTVVQPADFARLDEIPATTSSDHVRQLGNSTTHYVEVDFEDPVDTCIGGVRSLFSFRSAGNGQTSMRGQILDGSTLTCALGASNNYCNVQLTAGTTLYTQSHTVTAAALPWTETAVSGLKARWGFSDDANPDPVFENVLLEIAVVALSGSGIEGDAGTETGATASTTSASAATPCGKPVQIDGRACAYAEEQYSTAGPPHLSARLDLTGSGAGKAKIYKFQPATVAGATSYVWGRRTAGGGGVGTVKETVVRYPGRHEFGALPTGFTSGQAGWPGYWVKYDAGNAASSVTAEAGVGSAPPSFTSVGTISYWDGDSLETMSPPTNGQQVLIQTGPAWGTFGSYRVDICQDASKCSLVSNASYTQQLPTGAVGTVDRTEGRAVLGSPVAGQFTYKVTNTSTGAVVVDLTISVDLGTLTALAKYAPSQS